MSTRERLEAQLSEWDGKAHRWQLRAALDYPADLNRALSDARRRGVVSIELDGTDREDDLVRVAGRRS